MMKYRIKGSGLDTTDLYESPPLNFDFYNVDLRSNNGFLLKDVQGDIVCTVWTLDNLRQALEGLLWEIERPAIDVLLISAKSKMEKPDLENLKEVLESGLVETVGLAFPDSLEQLIEKTTALKNLIIPGCLALNLSPIYFQHDIIEWAKENKDLQIIGFNPFGGKLSAENCIRCFSVPYLLGFSSTYSDLVFLSSENLGRSLENLSYLNSLKDREEEKDIYKLEFSMNSLVRPFKKVIDTGIKLPGLVIPYQNPNLIFHPDEIILSLSKINQIIQEGNPEVEKIRQNLVDYLEISIPFPKNGNYLDYLSCVRPTLVQNLNKSGWEVSQVLLAKGIVVINIKKRLKEKRIFWKSKDVDISYNILLTVTEEGKIVFQDIKNASTIE